MTIVSRTKKMHKCLLSVKSPHVLKSKLKHIAGSIKACIGLPYMILKLIDIVLSARRSSSFICVMVSKK